MLDISMKFKKGILIVKLKGILDYTTVQLLEKEVNLVIKNNGIKYVLLNLKELSYIDATGFKAIDDAYRQIIKNDGKLILCGTDKLFKDKQIITNYLYQVSEEDLVYGMINI